mmetsp:Transcript_24288/g.75909  ORF Transcript_24288/g.75909 Transcript_24288/m.75909 type:complete len:128 (+) Transcript_24288:24-407(+)
MATRNRSNNAWFGGSAREKARTTEQDLMERQNDEHLDALSEQVAMLKNLTMEIDGEVKEQNTFLDQMGLGFAGAGEALSGTMQALDAMSKRAGGKFALFITLTIVGVFLLVWSVAKRARDPNQESVP